jgi:hypothetical protein
MMDGGWGAGVVGGPPATCLHHGRAGLSNTYQDGDDEWKCVSSGERRRLFALG